VLVRRARSRRSSGTRSLSVMPARQKSARLRGPPTTDGAAASGKPPTSREVRWALATILAFLPLECDHDERHGPPAWRIKLDSPISVTQWRLMRKVFIAIRGCAPADYPWGLFACAVFDAVHETKRAIRSRSASTTQQAVMFEALRRLRVHLADIGLRLSVPEQTFARLVTRTTNAATTKRAVRDFVDELRAARGIPPLPYSVHKWLRYPRSGSRRPKEA
jgi:hypothetical protein